MDPEEQLCILCNSKGIPSFADKLSSSSEYPICADGVDILQINTSRRCNLYCRHCHVLASPARGEIMSKENLQRSLDIVTSTDVSTIDLTGGAPELNPNLKWFIKEASKLDKRLIVRTNLAILVEENYRSFLDLYAGNNVEVVGSLPDHGETKTDRMRGNGTFKRCIKALQLLNDRGYGREDSRLILNLVHNPVGAILPGPQKALEHEYKEKLLQDHSVVFNSLFCITNMPVGRYLNYLMESGNYEDYMRELERAFNPDSVDNLMCKSTISVSWDGRLYDCDFNQMLNLPLGDDMPAHIDEFDIDRLQAREVTVNNHCYGCAAGSGSSCQGSVAD